MNLLARARRKLKRIIKEKYWQINSAQYKLYDSYDYFDRLNEIKPDTYETVHIPNIYKVSKNYEIEAFSPAMGIYLIKNAQVSVNTDIIIANGKVLWDKCFNLMHSKTNPLDVDLIQYDDKTVTIRNYKNIVKVKGRSLSLLGRFSDLWSHFILQYASKMYFAKEAKLLNEDLTVIVPVYKDEHVKKIVNDYLAPYGVKVLVAQDETRYECEELLFMPSSIAYPNSLNYFLSQDAVFPEVTKKGIKDTVVNPYIHDIRDYGHSSKIFLVRRSLTRNLSNWKEVEAFFVSEGFELIEPHKYSFDEKVSIFRNAEFVVGASSSSFYGMLWCKPGTKFLRFSTLARIPEPTLNEFANMTGSTLLTLTGNDLEKNNPHAMYNIPLEKIKEAYNYLKTI